MKYVLTTYLLILFAILSTGGAFAADALEAAVGACWACHGAGGPPKDPSIPIIQGQQVGYLEKQLHDFRSGEREDQIMSSMAESIPPKDMGRAAAMIAAMPWPKLGVETAGPAPDSVVACQSCHGADLAGGPGPEGVAPRLAGQFSQYLEAQMGVFARGERAKAATMTLMMKALDAAERAKIAKYLAGL
jgi:cytochrome c553